MSAAANWSGFRHERFCRPGMWLMNLTSALEYQGDGHVHADCVVDDFGVLQIVGVRALTANCLVVELPEVQ